MTDHKPSDSSSKWLTPAYYNVGHKCSERDFRQTLDQERAQETKGIAELDRLMAGWLGWEIPPRPASHLIHRPAICSQWNPSRLQNHIGGIFVTFSADMLGRIWDRAKCWSFSRRHAVRTYPTDWTNVLPHNVALNGETPRGGMDRHLIQYMGPVDLACERRAIWLHMVHRMPSQPSSLD